MELRHLQSFIAVAEELHFGRAAERLHLAQPGVSQQIRRLEEELGVQLLYRTKRQVQLTAAGQAFLKEARQVLFQAEQAVQIAKRAACGEVGQLKLSFTSPALYSLLPEIVRVFHKRYPDVKLTLNGICTEKQVEALRVGKVDVGFLHPPINEDFLNLEPILCEPLIVVLPENHPLSSKAIVPLSALAQELFILHPHDEGPVLYNQIIILCEQAGFHPKVVQEVVMHQTVIGLVAAGIGISFAPASLQKLKMSGVIYKTLEEPAPQLQLAAVFRQDDSSPVLQEFLKVVREIVRETARADNSP